MEELGSCLSPFVPDWPPWEMKSTPCRGWERVGSRHEYPQGWPLPPREDGDSKGKAHSHSHHAGNQKTPRPSSGAQRCCRNGQMASREQGAVSSEQALARWARPPSSSPRKREGTLLKAEAGGIDETAKWRIAPHHWPISYLAIGPLGHFAPMAR